MRQLIYSDKAIQGLQEIIAYIAATSQIRAKQYFEDLVSTLEVLILFPASRPLADPSKDNEIRKLVFNKLTIVLYRYNDEIIYIENIADSRSNWKV